MKNRNTNTTVNNNKTEKETITMKNTKRMGKFARKISAALAAVMMMSTAASVMASAQDTQAVVSNAVSASAAAGKKGFREKEFIDTAEKWFRKQHLDCLGQESIKVTITNRGAFHLKSCKFYARRLKEIGKDGRYILGDWELLHDDGLHGGTEVSFTMCGDYVQYAFTCDVTWGTDFPYSGIFWDDIDRSWAEDINITTNGFVRNVDVVIKVGDSTVVREENCSAHSEWKPKNDD